MDISVNMNNVTFYPIKERGKVRFRKIPVQKYLDIAFLA
jgi:hypothetical protein